MLNAGIDAPSGKNRQPWKFVVVQGDSKKELIKMLTDGAEADNDEQWKKRAMHSIGIMNEATVSILVFIEYGKKPWEKCDVFIAYKEIRKWSGINDQLKNLDETVVWRTG